jgi:hypothetical protein
MVARDDVPRLKVAGAVRCPELPCSQPVELEAAVSGCRDAADAASLLLPVLEKFACVLETKPTATHTPEVDCMGLATLDAEVKELKASACFFEDLKVFMRALAAAQVAATT